MATSNPKVSAYVPQPIKERLTQFREERSLSESQAVIAILAEYFQMEQSIDSSGKAGQVGGVTLGRMEALEERLANFAASVEHRLQQLGEEISRIGGLSVVHQIIPDETIPEGKQSDSLPSEPLAENQELEQVVTVDAAQVSSLLVEPPNEPLNQPDEKGEKVEAPQEVDNSSLPSELPNEVEQQGEESFVTDEKPSAVFVNLLGEPAIKLSGLALSRRLEVSKNTIRNNQEKADFPEWSRKRDDDKVAWKYSTELKGFVPNGELDSELLSKLTDWMKEDSAKRKS